MNPGISKSEFSFMILLVPKRTNTRAQTLEIETEVLGHNKRYKIDEILILLSDYKMV